MATQTTKTPAAKSTHMKTVDDYFAAAPKDKRAALYGTSSSFIDAHAAELKPYVQSKGTIQFPADKPLPYRLVTKIVKARIAKIEKAG